MISTNKQMIESFIAQHFSEDPEKAQIVQKAYETDPDRAIEIVELCILGDVPTEAASFLESGATGREITRALMARREAIEDGTTERTFIQ